MELLDIGEVRLGKDYLVIERPCSRAEAEKFINSSWEQIALTLNKFGFERGEVRFSDNAKPIAIWASLMEMVQTGTRNGEVKIFTAPVIEAWSDELITAFKEMAEDENPAGLVDMETQQQIWINNAATQMLSIPGEEAIRLNMNDFWFPPDLERFQQEMEGKNQGSEFVFDYVCRLATSSTGWASFSNTYRVVAGRYRMGVSRRAPEPVASPILV